MSKKDASITIVPLSSIHPDLEQPRKYFDAIKLNTLKESIEKHGILTPLSVLHRKEGGYVLVDGERRFRAAKLAKLIKIPVMVMEDSSATDALIKQFHLQEQHEGWTGPEKAIAMQKLSKALGLKINDLGRMLGINVNTLKHYINFASILDKKEFIRSDLPLKYAGYINAVKATAHTARDKMDEEYTVEDSAKLEKVLMKKIETGDIQNPSDFGKIQDAIRSDPKTVDKLLKGEKKVFNLFKESEAASMQAFRRLLWSVSYTQVYIDAGHKLGFQKWFADNAGARSRIKQAAETLTLLAREIA